jgi:hypothetical protein
MKTILINQTTSYWGIGVALIWNNKPFPIHRFKQTQKMVAIDEDSRK